MLEAGWAEGGRKEEGDIGDILLLYRSIKDTPFLDYIAINRWLDFLMFYTIMTRNQLPLFHHIMAVSTVVSIRTIAI